MMQINNHSQSRKYQTAALVFSGSWLCPSYALTGRVVVCCSCCTSPSLGRFALRIRDGLPFFGTRSFYASAVLSGFVLVFMTLLSVWLPLLSAGDCYEL